MTPAPMMPSRLGTSEKARAPSLSTIRSPSTSATGMRIGTEPVARTMCRAVRVRRSPEPCERDLDPAASLQGSEARDRFHLVLAQQSGNPTSQRPHHLVLARQHLAQVELDVSRLDAVGRQEVVEVVIVVRRIEKRLGRDAPDVQARAAERRLAARIEPCVDARGAEPELRGPNRRNVSAGAGPDDDDIEVVHELLSWRDRASSRRGMRGAPSRREPVGRSLPVAASSLHAGGHFMQT